MAIYENIPIILILVKKKKQRVEILLTWWLRLRPRFRLLLTWRLQLRLSLLPSFLFLHDKLITFRQFLFLEWFIGVVESGNYIERQNKQLYFGPHFLSEMSEGEVVIVNFKRKPRPFHCAGFSLILMEVFKGFRFFSCYNVELGIMIELLFNLTRTMHCSGHFSWFTPQIACSIRKSSFISAKLINIHFLFEIFQTKWKYKYALLLLSER